MDDLRLPLSVCLEDQHASPDDDRYMQCVALPGRTPGLCMTVKGRIGWKLSGPVACELWRGADGSLVLYRPDAGPDVPVEVRRAGRSLVVPFGKPVILRHQDELMVEGGAWRVHIHGATREVRPPSPLRRNLRAAFAALAVAVASAGCSDNPIDVRNNPPDIAPPQDAGDAGDGEAGEAGDGEAAEAGDASVGD
jgi:hypothetical protein